jgi:hypothetical protein
MSENVGASISRNPKGLHGLHGDNFTLPMVHYLIFPFLKHQDTILGVTSISMMWFIILFNSEYFLKA